MVPLTTMTEIFLSKQNSFTIYLQLLQILKLLSIFVGAKMESSGSDCDSNVDSEISGATVPISSHYQTGNYFIQLLKYLHMNRKKAKLYQKLRNVNICKWKCK